jgi:hypothetical protein
VKKSFLLICAGWRTVKLCDPKSQGVALRQPPNKSSFQSDAPPIQMASPEFMYPGK